MRTFEVRAHTTADPLSAFIAVEGFEAFTSLAPDVMSVTVHGGAAAGGSGRSSDWAVRFREGVARWSQRDDVSPRDLRIGFEQTTGDFERLHGSWQVLPAPSGCVVRFEMSVDLGVAIFDRIVEPLIARVVIRNVGNILTAILPAARLDGSADDGSAAERRIGSLLAAREQNSPE